MSEAIGRYTDDFGATHPLTLVAKVNDAIIRRAHGEASKARALDQEAFDQLTVVLGASHPYTICAGTSLATDLAKAGDHAGAVDLGRSMIERSRPYGEEHPYVLMRMVNLALDLRATGATAEADDMRQRAVDGLTAVLGPEHREVVTAGRGERLEGDIEPPPT
jgi:hypothetical protein